MNSIAEFPKGGSVGNVFHLPPSPGLRSLVHQIMSILSTEIPSGAELFSAGSFSEALNAYESIDKCNSENDSARDVCGGAINTKAVYAACNRAAAKLELEMCRSCVRDCDEVIRMDPYCLRAYLLKGDGEDCTRRNWVLMGNNRTASDLLFTYYCCTNNTAENPCST